MSNIALLVIFCLVHRVNLVQCQQLFGSGDLLPSAGGVCPPVCSCSAFETSTNITCILNQTDPVGLTTEIDSILKSLNDTLVTLKITKTCLTQVPESVCSLNKLKELELAVNLLTSLPSGCFTRLENLTRFNASSNKIARVQDGIFNGLLKLESIYLNDNQITFIEPQAFANRSDLTSLSVINIDNNLLTSLDPWPLIRGQVSPGCLVSIMANQLVNYTNTIDWKFTCGVDLPIDMKLQLDRNKIKHFLDMVRGWNSGRSFIHFVCLHGFHLDSKFSPSFNNIPLVCDCQDFKLFSFFQMSIMSKDMDGVNCAAPAKLALRRVLSVPLSDLICEKTAGCPVNCTCTKQPATLTMHINCSNAGLAFMPMELPVIQPSSFYRYNLIFSKNKFEKLEYRDYLAQTRDMDVSESRVDQLEERVWNAFSNLEMVFLNGNLLKEFPELVTSLDFSSVSLRIENNPIECICKSRWLKKWLLSLPNLQYSDGILCQSPEWLHGKNLVKLEDDDFCSNPPPTTKDIIEITIPSLTSLVLLNALVIFLLRKYRVRIHAVFNLHPLDRDECQGELMNYDVYLACSDEDGPLGLDILQTLEENGCKVCYHKRDFLGGYPIMENIEMAIDTSKRTLCLLTRNFFSSNYCQTEFMLAYHRDVHLGRRRLIALLDDRVDLNSDDISAEIRSYMTLYTYIDREQSGWLDQLLYAMPVNRMLN